MVHVLLLLLLLQIQLLLRVEGGWVLGQVDRGGACGCLTYQRRQGDGLAVLRGEWQMLRMRRVGAVWLAVGVRVGLVLRMACHNVWVKRWGLHSSAQGWKGVSQRECGLLGQSLLHGHGHHNWRGRGQLGIHLLQLGGRPGAVFWGERDVLLLQLLKVLVAGCCGRRQGYLTDLSAQGAHSGLDWGKG